MLGAIQIRIATGRDEALDYQRAGRATLARRCHASRSTIERDVHCRCKSTPSKRSHFVMAQAGQGRAQANRAGIARSRRQIYATRHVARMEIKNNAYGTALAQYAGVASLMPRQKLQETIGRRIDTGGLPTTAPNNLDVRRGTGATCDACGAQIGAVDIEHEFNYRDGRHFHLHFDCAALWVELCRQRGLYLVP